MPHLRLASNRAVSLHHNSFIIGSDPGCDLSLTDKSILPRHLILQPRGHQWQAATLNLRATVFVNERPLTGIALLNDGDRIRVGNVTMVWQEQDVVPTQGSPWMGLLSILLIVLMLMSGLFAWFYYTGISQSALATPIVAQQEDAKPKLHFQQLSKTGHPLYNIVVPIPQD